MVRIQNQ